jgi:predicted transcriptional regulator
MIMEEVVLENQKRSRLYEMISRYPGITFKELSQEVSYSVGTLQYHLKVLQKEEIIRKEMNNGRRSYYTFETRSHRIGSKINYGKHQLSPVQIEVLALITDNPEISQNEIARTMGINRFMLYYHLKILLERDLIIKRKEGRRVYYSRLNEEEIKKKLLLKLIDEFLSDEIDEQTYQRLKKLII